MTFVIELINKFQIHRKKPVKQLTNWSFELRNWRITAKWWPTYNSHNHPCYHSNITMVQTVRTRLIAIWVKYNRWRTGWKALKKKKNSISRKSKNYKYHSSCNFYKAIVFHTVLIIMCNFQLQRMKTCHSGPNQIISSIQIQTTAIRIRTSSPAIWIISMKVRKQHNNFYSFSICPFLLILFCLEDEVERLKKNLYDLIKSNEEKVSIPVLRSSITKDVLLNDSKCLGQENWRAHKTSVKVQAHSGNCA